MLSKNYDFDENDILEDGFADVPNAPHMEMEEQSDKHHLKVEIDSIDKLTGALRFATEKLNNAADRIENNHDLQAILQAIANFNSKDFSFLDKSVEQMVSKMEKSIKTEKINQTISENLAKIEAETQKVSQKYKKYAEAFNDEEVYQTFDKIEQMESFIQKFKFKTIIFASVISVVFGGFFGFISVQKFYELKKDQEMAAFYQNANEIQKVIIDNKIKLIQDNGKYLLINTKNLKDSYLSDNGYQVWELKK